jgi:hypothetical protein
MIIKIKLKSGQIIQESISSIQTVEMPYGCIGFGFNGSSNASEQDLNTFWKTVDFVLQQNNISRDEYDTLLSLTVE